MFLTFITVSTELKPYRTSENLHFELSVYRIKMNKIFTILFISFWNPGFGQAFLNLNFEYEIPGTQVPKKWRLVNQGYEINLDTSEYVSPGKSLRIQSNSPVKEDFGICSLTFPVSLAKGKTIEFRGKIKTEYVKNGYAGLWWNVLSHDKPIAFEKMEDRGLKGSNEWTEVNIRMTIDTSATHIEFGALLSGEGIAWFDDFEIFVADVKFLDDPPLAKEPTQSEIMWLKRHIHPLGTYDPKDSLTKDLEVLKKLVGDSKVVALGEVTHGSSEIFKMKHRIIKYLGENCGFNIFAIEANMPESYKLNDYIKNGKGNPPELLQGMYYWAWQTQEVLDMVEWMRAHNQGDGKIQFTGFDMLFYLGALKELENSFSNHESVLKTLLGLKEKIGNEKMSQQVVVSKSDVDEIGQRLNKIRNSISESNKSESEKDWLVQNIRIISQCINYNEISRDKYMAENLLWIKAHNPESKIALWAHNGHIKKTDMSMGKHIYDTLGADYLTIGFAFHSGFYTATGKNGVTSYKAQDSYIGTYEYFFKSLNEPIFLLDLRDIKEGDEENTGWLFRNLEFRNVGALKTENEFYETNLTQDFDLILFINQSSSSKLLR